MAGLIFTIGHSNQPLEIFFNHLKQHRIQILVDIRSRPYSKYARQFDASRLKASAIDAGIRYIYFGKELGGQPEDAEYYDDSGRVLYWRIAESGAFIKGISRLENGLQKCRIALMCSEEDPINCHRHLLIGRFFKQKGIDIRHIRADGRVQTESDLDYPEKSLENAQLPLFEVPQPIWKSTQSVSHRERQPTSLEA